MKQMIAAFLSGAVFSIGLIVSGMVDAANVLGFLDVFGAWNPSLAFVMGGGLLVTVLGYRWVKVKQATPCFADRFQWPTTTKIDTKLVLGSALFGLGWGIGGYCPGPALVGAVSGMSEALIVTTSMLVGMGVWSVVERLRQ